MAGIIAIIILVLIVGLFEEFGGGLFVAIGILLVLGGIVVANFDKISKRRLVRKAKKRFSNLEFVSLLIQDFTDSDWECLDYKRGGCQVLCDEIVTPFDKYSYSSYGLDRLDYAGCEQLAVYIGELYGSEYKVEKIMKSYAVACNSYSGRIGANGNVSVYQDYADGEVYRGHRVYSEASVPKPKSEVNKKW